MTLTDRDKKLALLLIPMVLLLGYWFMVLGPQRSELSTLDGRLAKAEASRDAAVTNVQRLQQSKTNYAQDYATVVKLGKATPSTLDMPSLLVQLESAAKGTKIDFDSITVGDRTAATTAAPATGSGSSSGATPVESGGEKPQTSAGQNTEKANEAADTADDRNATGSGATADGAGSGTGAASTTPVAGFDTVPLTFTFNGSYFDLADFFHRVKRFVRVASDNINVKGRLMTIDGMNLKSQAFPSITAQVTATVYLSPKNQGASGGGTAQGPTATPAASSSTGTTTPPASSTPTGAAE